MLREFLKWLAPLHSRLVLSCTYMGVFEMPWAFSLLFGTDMFYMEVFEVARASSLPFGVASFCRMKRVSVKTNDAVRSTVPPGLAIPHVSAGLVTLGVPDTSHVFFRTTEQFCLGCLGASRLYLLQGHVV
jgi:hypothetical protein